MVSVLCVSTIAVLSILWKVTNLSAEKAGRQAKASNVVMNLRINEKYCIGFILQR